MLVMLRLLCSDYVLFRCCFLMCRRPLGSTRTDPLFPFPSLFRSGHIGILPLLGLTLAFGVGVASIAPLWKRNLRRTPLFTWGMVIAHLGVAVSLAGMASESAFNKEELIAARPGDKVRIADW